MSGNPPQTHAPLEPPSDGRAPGPPSCRFCDAPLELSVVDLGMSPLCESYRSAAQTARDGGLLPAARARVRAVLLVQLEAFVPDEEIFEEYAYFSAFSSSWVEHARVYVESITGRLGLGPDDLVVELASNDGYLLQHFVGTGIPILGIDPAANIAVAAEERGVPTLVAFFGRHVAEQLVAEGKQAALVVGNNVLAQVPDLNDFVAGVKILLRADGTATFEFPHLQRLSTVCSTTRSTTSTSRTSRSRPSPRCSPPTGSRSMTWRSSRPTAARCGSTPSTRAGLARRCPPSAHCSLVRRDGLRTPSATRVLRGGQGVEAGPPGDADRATARRAQVVGYGAPGKGNTLLNYCGIRTDLLDYTVDRNPYKQGLFTPGTHIPIHPPERSPRPGPTTSSCCPGTSSTRSRASSRTSAIGAVG